MTGEHAAGHFAYQTRRNWCQVACPFHVAGSGSVVPCSPGVWMFGSTTVSTFTTVTDSARIQAFAALTASSMVAKVAP